MRGFGMASSPRVALRRPIVGLALCLAAGIGAGLHFAVPFVSCAAIAVLLCALAVFSERTVAGVFLAAAIAGSLLAGLAVRNPSGRCVANTLVRDREYGTVIGVVADDPGRIGEADEGVSTWVVSLSAEGLRRKVDWQRARGKVRVYWKAAAGDAPVAYGERWQIAGLLRADPGAGPARTVRLYADPAAARRLGSGQGNALVAMCLRARAACGRILEQGIASYGREVGLLRALLLGYREDMPDDLYRAFTQTGTLHIVAISGSHVGVFVIILVACVKALGLPRPYWILFIAPVLTAYTLGTGMSSSAVRACIMALVFWLAPFFRRRQDGPSALAFAAILVLAASPTQLIDAGFLLSFGIVGGLMLLYDPLAEPVRSRIRVDPWSVQPGGRMARLGRAGLMELWSLVAASVAAWLISTPMTAAFFNNVSFVSLAANLVVIPLSFVILLTGCLSLSLGACSVLLAEIFNHANRVFTSVLLAIVDACNTWPGGYVFVKSPWWVWVAAWYVIVAAVVLGNRRLRRAGLAVGTAAAVVVAGMYAFDTDVDVEMIGSAGAVVALVNVPGGGDVLVNTGPAWSGRKILKWLRARGVDRLQALVITSPRANVAGGAIRIVDQIPVGEIWTVPYEGRSPVFREILRLAVAKGIVVRRLAFGDRGALAGGAEWEVLHPARGAGYANAEEAGMVLRIARGPCSILYMDSCAERPSRELSGRPVDVVPDVLALGTSDACTDAWIRGLAAETIVHPVGSAPLRPGIASRQIVSLAYGDETTITLPE
ncbi:MAG: ComEC/Rec2 family competence protein [bacterium]